MHWYWGRIDFCASVVMLLNPYFEIIISDIHHCWCFCRKILSWAMDFNDTFLNFQIHTEFSKFHHLLRNFESLDPCPNHGSSGIITVSSLSWQTSYLPIKRNTLNLKNAWIWIDLNFFSFFFEDQKLKGECQKVSWSIYSAPVFGRIWK